MIGALRSRTAIPWRAARAVRRFVIDAPTRSAWFARLRRNADVHQDVTLTWPDRYPRLFAEAQRVMGADGRHRLLSFGCSSGEEVQALLRYFPHSEVIGAEINRAQLKACLALPPHPAMRFITSTPDTIAAAGPYDAIFCMAVFQRRPHEVIRDGQTNIARHYPFARFDAEIGALVAQLRPNGLLVVEHSQYLVEHSKAAAALVPVDGPGTRPAKGPRFDASGALITPAPTIARIFRKVV